MGIRINQITRESAGKQTSSLDNLLKKEITVFGSGFSNKKKEFFYAEISVLLKSGVDLKQTFDLIEESLQKEKDREIIKNLNESILEGQSFAEAMKREKYFSPYEYHAIKIGEQTGKLAFVTNDLAEFYQSKNEQRRQILSSLTYPIIVLSTALIVVFFMLKFVVPMFEDIFKQNKVELPFLTKIILEFSHVLEQRGLFILGVVIMFFLTIRLIKNKKLFRKHSSEFLLKIPFMGNYAKKIYLARFTHTMMLLTNSKIPVLNGLAMVREIIDFYPLQNSLKEIEDDILRGERMSSSFSRHRIFDRKIIALLKVAEETNQTEFVFKKLNDQYTQEVKYQAQFITNILNPLLTLMVGFIVGIILIAMYLPMFRLSSVIG